MQRPRDLELEAEGRMMRKIDDYIRKGARLYIRKMKAAKLAGRRHLTPASQKTTMGLQRRRDRNSSRCDLERCA